MSKPIAISELTSPEAGAVLKSTAFCILPLGSLEQHGHHLPLSTDTLIAAGLLEHLVKELKGRMTFTVLPFLPYGRSPEHGGFPGTVTLSRNTMVGVLMDISESLARHGAKRLLIVNAHGGNTSVIGSCLMDIWEKSGIKPYVFEIYGSETVRKTAAELDFHAGEVETSMMLYMYPEKVKKGAYPASWNYPKGDLARRRLHLPWKAEEFSPAGVIGDPRRAGADLGRDIIESLTKELSELLTAVLS